MDTLSTLVPRVPILKKLDWVLLASTGLIVLIGLSTIQSTVLANPTSQTILSGELINRQLLALALGAGLSLLLAWLNYRYLTYLAPVFYLLVLAGLVAVLVFGEEVRGAARWVQFGGISLQPSELAKTLLVAVFAAFFAWAGKKINQARYWSAALVLTALPMVLIYLEPDLGTMLVVGAVWLGSFYLSPFKAQKLLGFLGIVVVILPLTWNFLADYQKERLVSFLDPAQDPLGSGYNLIQSQIAVGSGQLFGLGWGRGTQSHLQFLPEQHTDFIFATFAEEQGFFGALVLLVLFTVLFWRGIIIARRAPDYLGQLLAWGVVALFAVQVFVNVAMNLGLAPITGIPLPLVSYGGSALIAHLAAIGILQSVAIHRI